MSQLSVDSITGRVSGSAPTLSNGAVISGVATATSFDGTATSATVATTLASAANITTGTISNDRLPATITKNLTGDVTGNVTGNVVGIASTANTLAAGATGVDLTLSGNLTVNGTTTTIDTAVTAVDSIAVDGAGTFGGAVTIVGDPGTNGTTVGNKISTTGLIRVARATDGPVFQGNKTDSSGYNVTINANGSADFAGTISDSIGPLRRLGIQAATGSFTLAADHAGKLVRSTGNGSTLTIPQNVFSAGDMISVFNVSTGDNTIAQGTGATLYNTADGATGNRTLGAKGVCTIVCTSNNEFIISGSQVS